MTTVRCDGAVLHSVIDGPVVELLTGGEGPEAEAVGSVEGPGDEGLAIGGPGGGCDGFVVVIDFHYTLPRLENERQPGSAHMLL